MPHDGSNSRAKKKTGVRGFFGWGGPEMVAFPPSD
jgi:hypothetical protein